MFKFEDFAKISHLTDSYCSQCDKEFHEGEELYHDDTDLLCITCHKIVYPKSRDWLTRICLDENNSIEHLNLLSDIELNSLADTTLEGDCDCYFTEAESFYEESYEGFYSNYSNSEKPLYHLIDLENQKEFYFYWQSTAMLYISELTGMLPSKYEQLVNGAVILERKYILRREGRDKKWKNWK